MDPRILNQIARKMDQSASLRYPIGYREKPSVVTSAHRAAWIEEIRAAPGALRNAVADLTQNQLDTPYRPGGWTIRQVVHHLPDSHMNAYIRFRWTLTEEAPVIKTYREAQWAELPDGKSGDIELSLNLLEALHRRWVVLLRSLNEEDWKRTCVHPEDGPRSLENFLAVYAWHGKHHIAHIQSLRERRGWQ